MHVYQCLEMTILYIKKSLKNFKCKRINESGVKSGNIILGQIEWKYWKVKGVFKHLLLH